MKKIIDFFKRNKKDKKKMGKLYDISIHELDSNGNVVLLESSDGETPLCTVTQTDTSKYINTKETIIFKILESVLIFCDSTISGTARFKPCWSSIGAITIIMISNTRNISVKGVILISLKLSLIY